MCYPLLIMAAISVATAIVSNQEQKKSANRQEQAIQDGLARDREATAEQYRQINKAAMDDQAQLHTSYLIDAARLQAIQGESGMQGATYERVANEAENNAEADMATLERNRVNQNTQARTQGAAQQSRGSLQLAGIQRPSNVGTALQIAGAAYSAYGASSAGSKPAEKTPTNKAPA
ncbi:MAG: hypothetical protein HYU74_09085 [Dechloromonas sp.]|nr:hypothetical protein [Dechloromonas sp.]